MYKVIEDFEDLKSIYMFAFELFRDRDISHKMLKYEAAVSIWGQLILPSTYKYKVEWDEFLKVYQSDIPIKKMITLDVWNMFYTFMKMTNENDEVINEAIEDGIWPVIIDAFARYLKDIKK